MRGKSLFLAVAAVMLFCGAAMAGQYKIGYLCNNFNDTFQTYIVDAARAFADKTPEITLEVMDAQEDVVRQQDQVATLLQSGVNALVVVPVNTQAVGPIVRAAQDAKVPLVFVNRNPYPTKQPPEGVYFIGADSVLEGETQMLDAGKRLGGKGNIVILMGLLSNEAAHARTEGVKNIIKKDYPDIKILAEETANWQRDQGMNVTENWITAYGKEINAVMSNNDEMALGALLALNKAGMDKVLIYGVDAISDALTAIEQGKMTGTVRQDPVAQGAGSVKMAVEILKGNKPAEQINKLPAVLITKDNVAQFK